MELRSNLKANFPANFTFWLLSIFFVVDLFNPLFKKYDYGAEYPLVLVFGVLVAVFALVEFSHRLGAGRAMPDGRQARERVSWEKIFLLLFGLFTILSFAFSQTKNVGFSEVLAFLSMIVFYLIFANRGLEWKEKFLRVVKIVTILAVAMGFVLYFTLENVRMFGPFFNILARGNNWPNAFALFLLMTWPIFLLPQKAFSKDKSCVRAILLAFTIAALLLTFSRGAVIALLAQVAILAIYNFRKIGKRQLLGALGVAAMAITIFFGSNYLRGLNHQVIDVEKRVTFSNGEAITSGQERLEFWKGAVKLMMEKPLFGWGPFSFRYAYNPIQKTFLANADHPHNIFLKIAVENGMPAVLFFAVFLLSIFILIIKRFGNLDQKSKDLVFILSLAVAGALAHSLIDYNFNFFANLLLLFIYLIFIRSTIVKETEEGKDYTILLFGLTIGIIAMYEGFYWDMAKFGKDEKALEHSLFPREHFNNTAMEQIKNKNFMDALANLDYQLQINPLDGAAWHLKAGIDCSREYKFSNNEDCAKDVSEALRLNPMNDFSYYLDYFKQGVRPADFDFVLVKCLDLLEKYLQYVDKNVHFTAYSLNVEQAAELIDLLAGKVQGSERIKFLQGGGGKMLERARILREEKTF